MRYLRLSRLFLRLGLQGEMEYRANFLIHTFESLMMLATGLSVLWVVFSQTKSIGGWSWNELLVIMGLYFVTFGLVGVIIAPSIKQFMGEIWTGALDFVLTKPVNHQFLISTRKIMVWGSVEVILGMSIIGVALFRLKSTIGWEEGVKFALTGAAGLALLYSCWVCLGTLAFWTTRIENLMLVFFNMYEAGRWPVGLYPTWLKFSLTFIVPVTFAVTFPAQALTGRLSWVLTLTAVGIAIPAVFLSSRFLRMGLKRYTGASS